MKKPKDLNNELKERIEIYKSRIEFVKKLTPNTHFDRRKAITRVAYDYFGYPTKKYSGKNYVEVNNENHLYSQSILSDQGYLAVEICNSKDQTKQLLSESGISVAKGKKFRSNQKGQALNFTLSLNSAVIKPSDSKQSKGVTIGVKNENSFTEAWEAALNNSQYENAVIIEEEFISGIYARVVVDHGEVIAAAICIGPYVIGNGVDTIDELISQKNCMRDKNPRLKGKYILLNEERCSLLYEQGYTKDSTPKAGELIVIDTNPSHSNGGEPIEALDLIDPKYKEIALKATSSIPGLNNSALDILATDYFQPPSYDDYIVMEVNKNGSLGAHNYPNFRLPNRIAYTMVRNHLKAINKKRYQQKLTEKNNQDNKALIPMQKIKYDIYKNKYSTEAFLSDEQIIEHEFLKQGFNVKKQSDFIHVDLDGEVVLLRGSITSNLAYLAAKTTAQRYFRSYFLNKLGISSAAQHFTPNYQTEAFEFARHFSSVEIEFYANKLSVNNITKEIFDEKWSEVLKYYQGTKRKTKRNILVYSTDSRAHSIRCFVVNSKCVAVSENLNPTVRGDGYNSITELIKDANMYRKNNPYYTKKTIQINDRIKKNINDQGYHMEDILEHNKRLVIDYDKDLAKQGENIDITDNVDLSIKSIAEKAVNIVAGIDVATVCIECDRIDSEINEESYHISDIITGPELGEFVYPMYGKSRNVASDIVNYLIEDQMFKRLLYNGASN